MVKNWNSSKSNTSEVDGGGGPDNIDTPDSVKNFNSSKSNTSKVDGGGGGDGSDPQMGSKVDLHHGSKAVGGGGGPDPQMGKNFNSSKSNTSEVDGGGGPDNIDTPDSVKNFNSSKSNTSKVDGGGGGDGPDPQMYKNWNSSKSNTSAVDGGGDGGEPQGRATGEQHVILDPGGTEVDGGTSTWTIQRWFLSENRKGDGDSSTRSNTTSVKKGPGIVRKGVGKTRSLAKTMIMTAVLISVAGAGVDVYQTYNDAIAIDLEKHITDADFELSDDKSEISGTVGFDIPEMGMFEKSIIASVHVTILESSPTTDGDYEFEYTLGSGEQFYDFTLDDLDPVTVEKIEAGESLDIEYSGTISVTYLGVEIPSFTMDIPLTTTTVETA